MSTPLVIIGCGGFGREVFSLVATLVAAGETAWWVEGFADDAPSVENLKRVATLGVGVMSSVRELRDRRSPYAAVVAVGGPEARAGIVARLSDTAVIFPSLVHPAATVGLEVQLGEGVVIAAGARLSTDISIGRHVHVDQNVTIGHDTQVRQYARLSPQACLSGCVDIGERALVGANATVLPGLHIGASAVVGAGAVVVKHVAPGATVKGVPAR